MMDNSKNKKAWKILIVDDQKLIHKQIESHLEDLTYSEKSLQFINAYSAEEAVLVVKENPDIAVLLLDIVMESRTSGLEFLRYFRNILGRISTRVILLTNFPQKAPEAQIALDYSIHHYKAKADLTKENLNSIVITALRTYEEVFHNLEIQKRLDSERNFFMRGPVSVIEWGDSSHWPILYTSSNIDSILGYSSKEVEKLKLNYMEMIFPDDLQQIKNELQTLSLSGKTEVEQEYRIVRRDSKVIWLRVFTSIHRNKESGRVEYIGFVIDNTLQKELKGREKIEEELRNSLEAETRFIASVSHEFRTPLSSILGYIELLKDTTSLSNEQQNYCRNISFNSQHLLTLINDVLDISKIESGQLELLETEVAISEVLSECAVMLSNRIKAEVKLHVDIPEFDFFFICDPIRIKQIFINLLSNSAKFTDKGYIRLFFKDYTELEDGMIKIQFSVEDTGIGIPKEKQSQLYQPFKQVHAGQYGGTGLGLYLSRSIAQLMSGEIEMDSIEGVGSTFTVSLVLKKGKQKDEGFFFQNKKILFIESESILSSTQQTDLKQAGAQISRLQYMAEEISLYKSILEFDDLDAAIIDMDVVGGKTVYIAGLLKENCKSISILGVKSDSNTQTFLELDDTLTKPFTFHGIGKKLNQFFGNIPKELHQDFSSLRILIAEDVEANRLLFRQMFYKFFGVFPDTAPDGREALKKVRKNHYDIVFMDIQMPHMDGIEATKKIREFNQQIPIVALTGNVFIEDISRTREAGMNDFLSKPIQQADIQQILNNLSMQSYGTLESEKQPSSDKKQKPKASSIVKQITDFIQQVCPDEQARDEIVRTAVTEIIVLLKKIRQSQTEEDNADLLKQIHQLKGLLLNIGLNIQGGMVRELETLLQNKVDKALVRNKIEALFNELANIEEAL